MGDSLSTSLFNIAFEYVIRKIDRGTLRKWGKIVAYADDIVLVTKKWKIMRKFQRTVRVRRKMKMQINKKGVTLLNDGEKKADITEKILTAKRELQANRKLLKSGILGKTRKWR